MKDTGSEVTLDRDTLEGLVYTLKLYMLGDRCACEGTCSDDCELCLWCCGKTAIRHSGVTL